MSDRHTDGDTEREDSPWDRGVLEAAVRTDVAVVVVLAGLGTYLMVENIRTYSPNIRVDSHSWWLVPVWLAAVLPLLWWRRNPLAVALIVTAVMAVHVLAFGWVARCGAGLPLTWVLAYPGRHPRQPAPLPARAGRRPGRWVSSCWSVTRRPAPTSRRTSLC